MKITYTDNQIQWLLSLGLKENIDFRIVYFNQYKEIKIINK